MWLSRARSGNCSTNPDLLPDKNKLQTRRQPGRSNISVFRGYPVAEVKAFEIRVIPYTTISSSSFWIFLFVNHQHVWMIVAVPLMRVRVVFLRVWELGIFVASISAHKSGSHFSRRLTQESSPKCNNYRPSVWPCQKSRKRGAISLTSSQLFLTQSLWLETEWFNS